MSIKLGMEAKIYYDPAGVANGNWTELGNVKDVTLNLETGEADVTTRANQGWRATAPTLRECTAEFEMLWQPGDAGFEAVKTAFLSAGTIALAILTGDKAASGTEGPIGDFSITNFSRNEALEEAIVADVTAKLAVLVEWHEVA